MSCTVLSSEKAGGQNHVYELSPAICEEYFGGYRCARVGTIGEGSCFYHSLAFVTNYQDYAYTTSDKQKKEIVYTWRRERFAKTFTPEIYAKIKDKSKTYDELIENFQNPRKWADEIQINHVANVLNLNILFLDLSKNTFYCGTHNKRVLYSPENTKDVPTVIVAWVTHSHFEPIVRLDDPAEGRLRTMFTAQNAFDQQFIQSIMHEYKEVCNLK